MSSSQYVYGIRFAVHGVTYLLFFWIKDADCIHFMWVRIQFFKETKKSCRKIWKLNYWIQVLVCLPCALGTRYGTFWFFRSGSTNSDCILYTALEGLIILLDFTTNICEVEISVADPDPACHFDADPIPDPTFHFHADQDPVRILASK